MFKKREILKSINMYLTALSIYIENENKNNLTDSNTLSEDFYCRLLNKVYGYELQNLNRLKMNFPAIDLGDDENKICYQITSTSKPEKVRKTLQKFTDEELYKDYDSLYIFIINSKKPKKTDYNYPFVDFNSTHIKNISDLYGDIMIKNLREMGEILSIFEEELNFLKIKAPIKYLDNINNTSFKYGINYNNFIEDMYGYDLKNPNDKECFTDCKKALDIFVKVLSELHYNTREFIVAIIKRRVYKEQRDKIFFNRHDVMKYMNLDLDTFNSELKILYDKKLINVIENTEEDADTLLYDDEGNNLFYDIVMYCKKRNISRKELFLDLDFTLLD